MESKQLKSFYEPTKQSFNISRQKKKIPSSMARCHYHNNYELYYLRSGKRYYFIKDKTYFIDEGTFVFIKKFDIHATETYENEGYERILITFDDDFINPLLSSIGEESLFERFLGNDCIIKISEDDRVLCETLLLNMLAEHERDEGEATPYLKSSLLTILMLMRSQKKDTPEPVENNVASRKTISDIVGYINNNYFEDINLKLIASKFYISPYYFSRSFKRISGLGFNEYLNNVRVKEAKKLLTSTQLSITDISAQVGYKSPTNFGRVFYKITGRTPLQYRTEHKHMYL